MRTIAILTSQLRLEPGAVHKYWTSQDRVRVRGGPCDWGIALEMKVIRRFPKISQLVGAFSWLKAPSSAFTFKTLLRHYAKLALTPSRDLLRDCENFAD